MLTFLDLDKPIVSDIVDISNFLDQLILKTYQIILFEFVELLEVHEDQIEEDFDHSLETRHDVPVKSFSREDFEESHRLDNGTHYKVVNVDGLIFRVDNRGEFDAEEAFGEIHRSVDKGISVIVRFEIEEIVGEKEFSFLAAKCALVLPRISLH